jgi:replication initiation and membrane attachment protein DnaB
MNDLKAFFLVKVFMDTGEKQQKMSIGLFKPITKDECQSILQHEVHLWNKVGHGKNTHYIMKKCLVG